MCFVFGPEVKKALSSTSLCVEIKNALAEICLKGLYNLYNIQQHDAHVYLDEKYIPKTTTSMGKIASYLTMHS